MVAFPDQLGLFVGWLVGNRNVLVAAWVCMYVVPSSRIPSSPSLIRTPNSPSLLPLAQASGSPSGSGSTGDRLTGPGPFQFGFLGPCSRPGVGTHWDCCVPVWCEMAAHAFTHCRLEAGAVAGARA